MSAGNEKAIGFRITVFPDQIERETSGGIVKYTDHDWEVAQRAVDVGTVLDIGGAAFKLDRFGNECPIKKGDKIRFKLYAMHLYRDKDEFGRSVGPWYGVINDDDVLTIVESA